ncbi:MAG: hypothetical protein IKH23_05535 [Clostridiales bacterium]|nr:hypothetical protein [Clostridiales bacterium]
MLRGKSYTSAVLVAAFIICTVSACTPKQTEPAPSTVHTTWQETTTSTAAPTTETTTETTVDPVIARQPFEGTWMGILKVGKSKAYYTITFNSDGTGSQSCSGKTQSFRYADPDTAKKTIRVTPESGAEFTISYYNGENSSNKTFTFSSGLIVDSDVPSVDCLRVRATDPSLIGTWVAGKGKKAKTIVFKADNTMTEMGSSTVYTIERKFDGTQVIRTLNGDIRYTVEGTTLFLETNNTDIDKEWKKK